MCIRDSLKYSTQFGEDWEFKVGNQNIITDNTNVPGTGILPLIPNYVSWRNGVFSTISKRQNKMYYHLGFRYDHEYQNAPTISNTIPREIIRFVNNFDNVAGLLTINSDIADHQSISWNIGYTTRNPAINELYSSGLHQGVSGIEEGDPDLNTEKALKNTLEYKWFPNSEFTLNALLYHQNFQDYIFLNPQEEFRLTIRGAFPVFKYEQTSANIYGLDLSTQFTLGHSLQGVLRYSYLRGNDTQNNIPLVFMPPNSFYGSLTYRGYKSIRLSKRLKMEETEIEVSNRFVFEQNNILDEQDFAPPPGSYNLVNVKLSTNFIFPAYKLRSFIKVENLLNTTYRDYLNRQRYFADEQGLSLIVGVNIKF